MDGGTTESAGGGRTIVEDLENLEGWWNASKIVLWSFVLFGAFLLNATLLLAFLKRPGLRTISNRFVMNLTVSNLLTCAVLNPLLMLDGRTSSGTTMCSMAESATALVTSSSVYSVLLIAIDQYLAVVDPLRYRTRIDKPKCGILVISGWLVSLIFAVSAALNPSPRSIWLVCEKSNFELLTNTAFNETTNFITNENLRTRVNTTEVNNEAIDGESTFVEYENDKNNIYNNRTLEILKNSIGASFSNLGVTYGLVYTIVHALVAYLAPFICVCWIYVRIYSAAHKNSERTRRTGSRPILSSGSFSEEYYPVRQDASSEDFRRIPKISSLSSIEETIETHAPSQTAIPRRTSEIFSTSNRTSQTNEATTIEEEEGEEEDSKDDERRVTVVFTVGSSKVDLTQREYESEDETDIEKSNNEAATKDNVTNNKVPTSVLKSRFLDNGAINRDIKNDSHDRLKNKRKSSRDLIYDVMLRRNIDKLVIDRSNPSTDEEDDDDEERDYERSNDVAVLDTEIDANPIENQSSIIVNDKHRKISVPIDSTSRKNSIDLSIPDSQSSVSKIQGINGKTNSRINSIINWHRNERSSVISDEPFYGKTSITNFEIQQDYPDRNTPIVTITPPNRSCLQRVSSVRSTSSYIHSLKHRISNGSLFKYREETRAARISALVIVMGLLCWTPYVVVSIIKNLSTIVNVSDINRETEIVSVSFVVLATYVSPLLFGYRSRRVKRELRKFFCFKRELSYKNNRSLMAKKVLKRRHSGNVSQLDIDPRYNIFNCVYGRTRWPKDKVHFVQVPETALVVETCRSSFSSGASTQISSTSTEEC